MNIFKSLINSNLFVINSAFFNHILHAGDAHSIHSPFVFELYQTLIRADDKSALPDFYRIEALRKSLRQSHDTLDVTDFGAGARLAPGQVGPATSVQSVGRIARNSLKPARYGRLLHRLVGRFAPGGTVLELGTSLGITTAYLATQTSAHDTLSTARLVTFEGCPNTAGLAQTHFDQLGLSQIEIIVGNLDETLPATLAGINTVDLAFLDANHRFAPTIRYVEQLLAKAHNHSVFVLDDIHWSAEMERAWATIQAHSAVTVTIDLFGVGLVFFRQEQPRQHFTLRF